MNIEENLQRALQSYDLNSETLLKLYEQVLRPRRIEERMLILLRQGKISKWFSGIGQEAIAVGVTMALEIWVFLPQEKCLCIAYSVSGKAKRMDLLKDAIAVFILVRKTIKLWE